MEQEDLQNQLKGLLEAPQPTNKQLSVSSGYMEMDFHESVLCQCSLPQKETSGVKAIQTGRRFTYNFLLFE